MTDKIGTAVYSGSDGDPAEKGGADGAVLQPSYSAGPGFEVGSVEEEFAAELGELKQGLEQRHIQMIALAGTIGTGLFLGSGSALALAGPLGIFLAYMTTGLAAAAVVLAVGEMGALVPLSGGITRYAETFVDPSLSFAIGWNFVISNLISIPNEITAAAVLVEFWGVNVNVALWIVIFSIAVLVASLLFVRIYGEMEFTFACLKIFLVVFVNMMALIITCGGGPDHQAIGFRFWHAPTGPFQQYLGIAGSLGRFLGFWKVINKSVFAFSGIETITMAAAELSNPRTAIPMAARRIFVRIIVFYLVTIFMIGLVVSSQNKALTSGGGSAASPFVVAARTAGIKVVPSLINAIVISSAWSAANSFMLAGSRTLYALAKAGRGPAIFSRINRFGIPWVSVSFFGIWMCLGLLSAESSASEVFDWLASIVAIASLLTWLVILIVYLRFFYGCRAQGIDRRELPWASPFQPYASWVSLVLFSLLLLTSGFSVFIDGHWSTKSFISSYINIPIFIVLYCGYKFSRKTTMIPLDQIPIRRYIQHALDHPEPPMEPKRGWQKLNILWS